MPLPVEKFSVIPHPLRRSPIWPVSAQPALTVCPVVKVTCTVNR